MPVTAEPSMVVHHQFFTSTPTEPCFFASLVNEMHGLFHTRLLHSYEKYAFKF